MPNLPVTEAAVESGELVAAATSCEWCSESTEEINNAYTQLDQARAERDELRAERDGAQAATFARATERDAYKAQLRALLQAIAEHKGGIAEIRGDLVDNDWGPDRALYAVADKIREDTDRGQ